MTEVSYYIATLQKRIEDLELERDQALARIAELECPTFGGGGARILEGLRQAIRGEFSRVTIEGQTWVRHDAGSPEDMLARSRSSIADLTTGRDVLNARIAELEEALRPFAAIPLLRFDHPLAALVDLMPDSARIDEAPHYWCVIGHPTKSHFTREDLERARNALQDRRSEPDTAALDHDQTNAALELLHNEMLRIAEHASPGVRGSHVELLAKAWQNTKDSLSPATAIALCDAWLEKDGNGEAHREEG